MTWEESREEELEDLFDEFGATLTFKGVSYSCLAPPTVKEKEMTTGPRIFQRSGGTWSMRKADFATSGIQLFDAFTFDGDQFVVNAIEGDPADASVDLKAERKQ